MKKLSYLLIPLAIVACNSGSQTTEESADETAAPGTVETETVEDAGVYFIEPADGAELTSPVTVKMGVSGMEIEPAGMVSEGKGHHHLIIDGSFIEKGVVVPADSTHIHYGKGQTEVQLDLKPGTHTLTMQFADGVHTSYGEEWSATISVNVVENQ